jgi:CheY-like chemotaxis protein
MGGQIAAQSEPGKGSLFSVVLPLPAAPADEAGLETPGVAPLSAPLKLRVLVAEDNLVNQKVAAGILKRQGWTVTVASTGRQAYQAFLTNYFDLILMDVQMPELDGLEAAALIRQEEHKRSLARTPIVAVTAHASTAQHEQCLAHGMDAVVTKPIDIAALLKTIERVRANLNPGLDIQGIVLTMFDRRNKLSDQVAADVRAHMGDKVYKTVIPRNVRISEAPSHGLPALVYDLRCPGSQAYIKLAGEMIQREKLRPAA